MNRRWFFLFWGGMDLLALVRFVVVALMSHRVPFYDDFLDFMALSADHGWYGGLIFCLSMLLYLSLFLSLYLFFRNSRLAKFVAYVQIPFRLLLAVPSISFLSWLAVAFGGTSVVVIIALKVASELIKFLTLHFGCKSKETL